MEGSGKTTLLERMKNSFKSTKKTKELPKELIRPTLGMNVYEFTWKIAKVFRFFDLGGNSDFRPIWKEYLLDSQAVLFVIKHEDEISLNEVVRNEIEALLADENCPEVFVLLLNDFVVKYSTEQLAGILKEKLDLPELKKKYPKIAIDAFHINSEKMKGFNGFWDHLCNVIPKTKQKTSQGSH